MQLIKPMIISKGSTLCQTIMEVDSILVLLTASYSRHGTTSASQSSVTANYY